MQEVLERIPKGNLFQKVPLGPLRGFPRHFAGPPATSIVAVCLMSAEEAPT